MVNIYSQDEAALILVCVPAAFGQAILTFSGGSEYDSYYGSLGGDVIGWRFTVNQTVYVTELGIWNVDQTGGVESDHEVGIWDSSQVLLGSVVVNGTGAVVGDFIYATVPSIALSTGETYTIGASFASGDDDWYISSATSYTSAAEVTWANAVYATAGDLGFVYPGLDSAPSSIGRFGPNFLFNLTSLERTTWGSITATF